LKALEWLGNQLYKVLSYNEEIVVENLLVVFDGIGMVETIYI